MMMESLGSYSIPFSTVCRTCLKVSKEMSSLHNSETIEMLMDCASLQIIHGDGMPSLICMQCLKQVNKSYNFKKLCEKSDSTLKQYILHGYLPSELLPGLECDVTVIENNNCTDSFITSEIILENLPEDDALFAATQHLTSLSGSQSEDDDTTGFTDCPEVGLEPECNLVENALAALQEDIKRSEIRIDDTSWLQQTITIINEGTEIHDDTFAKPRPVLRDRIEILNDPPVITSLDDDLDDFFPCSVENCAESFKSLDDLNIHMSIHWNDDGFECNVCNKKYNQMKMLKRHIKTHMSWKAHKCKICSKEFTEAGILNRHLKRHGPILKEKKYTCKICGQGYQDSHYFSIHMRKHTGEKPFVCEYCDKTFSDPRLLASHIKTHKKEKTYQCTVCDKSFIHSSTLHTHMRTHTGEKPYSCTVCDKKFKQSSNLSLHMRTHTGVKPYSCNMCDKSFASSSRLMCHIRIHTGEKPYACAVCGKSFARTEDVSLHMRVHTGEKPYACSVCDKKFTTSSHRNKHELVHAKPHICKVCGGSFSSMPSLRKHLKTHEENVEQNPPENTIIISQELHQILVTQ